jgi:hypothetical protein
MLIANPIYDTAFKRLLENDRVARFFIGTLLGKPVLSIVPGSQEFTWKQVETPEPKKKKSDKPTPAEKARIKGRESFTVYRMDYVATVEMRKGEHKKVIIEMQKAKHEEDLERFRNYLAENYRRVDKVNGEEVMLPIIAIYVLGFNLPEIKTPCFRVHRTYEDLLTKKRINKKSPFVERLTHDGYFVQVQRISGKPRTKLDELLSLFEQDNFEDFEETAKFYNYKLSDPDIKTMAKILEHMSADQKLRAELEAEAEEDRTRNEWLRNQKRRDAELAQKNQTLSAQAAEIVALKKLLGQKK